MVRDRVLAAHSRAAGRVLRIAGHTLWVITSKCSGLILKSAEAPGIPAALVLVLDGGVSLLPRCAV